MAVHWTVPEPHSAQALVLLRDAESIHAPAHWLAEAANALWPMHSVRRELTRDELRQRIARLAEAPVQVTPLTDLIESAAEIAAELGVTMYDALYLALAAQQDVPLVTADRRLVARTRETAHAGRTHWIGDLG